MKTQAERIQAMHAIAGIPLCFSVFFFLITVASLFSLDRQSSQITVLSLAGALCGLLGFWQLHRADKAIEQARWKEITALASELTKQIHPDDWNKKRSRLLELLSPFFVPYGKRKRLKDALETEAEWSIGLVVTIQFGIDRIAKKQKFARSDWLMPTHDNEA